MIKHGVERNEYSLKDYSHEQTFGAIDPKMFEAEYNADLGLSFPDQNADGLPNGCTGYTQTEIGQDENGEFFDPKFTYENTLILADLPPHSPCKIRDSFKETRTRGLKRKDNDSTLVRGAYYDVDKNGDYFDGIRSALYLNRIASRTISAASPWFPEWRKAIDGILIAPKKYVWEAVGHNYKICGWKTIKSEPYLIIKPWTGASWGDKGYGYMSREICNKLFLISGTAIYIQSNLTASEVKTIKLDIMELILTFLNRLIKIMPSQDNITTVSLQEKYPEKLMPNKSDHLYDVAYSFIGKDASPKELAPDVVSCAESLSCVMIAAGVPDLHNPILGTAQLNQWLHDHFTEVEVPELGDIVMSATGSGNGRIKGHCGVMGKHTVMSNNSQSGLWDYHWTLDEWKKYYEIRGGIPTKYYRWI